LNRLRNPYFQVGYSLELIVEAAIFLAAFWSFSRFAFAPAAPAQPAATEKEREEARASV
jgi:hypothetical protein